MAAGNPTDNELSIDKRSVAEHAQDFTTKEIMPEEKSGGNDPGLDSGLWNGNPLPDEPMGTPFC